MIEYFLGKVFYFRRKKKISIKAKKKNHQSNADRKGGILLH